MNQAGVPGPWSEPVSAMVEEEVMATAGAPGKPVISAAPKEPNRREEILVSWTKPVENGSAIVSYTLEISDSGRENTWSDSDATLDGSATSWTHTGLTGGTRKFYRLLATNLCDTNHPALECHSLWSDTVNATTDPPGQSGPPTNVDAVPDGDTAIDVTWAAPVDDGGTPITGYEVQWSADGLTGWQYAGSTSDGDTVTFKNTGDDIRHDALLPGGGAQQLGPERLVGPTAPLRDDAGWRAGPAEPDGPRCRRQHHRADMDRSHGQRRPHNALRNRVVRGWVCQWLGSAYDRRRIGYVVQ